MAGDGLRGWRHECDFAPRSGGAGPASGRGRGRSAQGAGHPVGQGGRVCRRCRYLGIQGYLGRPRNAAARRACCVRPAGSAEMPDDLRRAWRVPGRRVRDGACLRLSHRGARCLVRLSRGAAGPASGSGRHIPLACPDRSGRGDDADADGQDGAYEKSQGTGHCGCRGRGAPRRLRRGRCGERRSGGPRQGAESARLELWDRPQLCGAADAQPDRKESAQGALPGAPRTDRSVGRARR